MGNPIHRRWVLLLPALALPVTVLVACEMIAGIDDMAVYRPVGDDAGMNEDVQEETGPVECTLGEENPPPSTALRFANLVPSADSVDFCVKQSSEADYQARPIIRGHGSQCPALAYGQVLIPLGVEGGAYDVKVVSSDSDCAGAGLSELTSVDVPEGRTVTIVRVGGAGGVAEKLVAHAEIRFSKDQSTRLMHAVASEEVLFFGIALSEQVPTEISAPFTEGLVMGAVPQANSQVVGLGEINDAGYLGTMSASFNLGATRPGKNEAIFVGMPTGGQVFTVFAIGLPGSFEFPVRGLVCKEDRYLGADTNGVARDYLTHCEPTKLKELTVNTINVGLYGDFAPFEKVRRDPLIQAVANLSGDFVCVQEMAREVDRAELLATAASAGTFPHAYNPQFDLDTEITDPRDQSGGMPPSLGPACSGATAKFQAAIECVTNQCAEEPGNPDTSLGGLGTRCFSSNCAAQFIPLLTGQPDDARCLSCLFVNLLSSETMTDTEELCLNDSRQQLAFRGASTAAMLSKYPLSDMESYILPSTSYRRAILYAKAEVASGEFVDVYCMHLNYIQGATFAYSGQYGAETVVDGIESPLKGWTSEQYLQGQRTVEWIKGRVQGEGLAILAGDLSSGDADAANLVELNPATVRLFRANFFEALAPGYAPKCTLCAFPENPYGGEEGVWMAHIFTAGREIGVLSTDRTLMEKSVALPEAPFEGTVSDNFGLRSQILYGLTW